MFRKCVSFSCSKQIVWNLPRHFNVAFMVKCVSANDCVISTYVAGLGTTCDVTSGDDCVMSSRVMQIIDPSQKVANLLHFCSMNCEAQDKELNV